MRTVRISYLGVGLILMAILLAGCSSGSTPPGANSLGGVGEGANYTYHYWEDGLAVLIWHDFSQDAESCTGSGSTEDLIYRLECTVQAQDRRRFTWQIHTSDGQTADMWIDGQPINLSKGSMFLIRADDDGLEVNQQQRDFSALAPNNETFVAMAASDADVAAFIKSLQPVSDSANNGSANGLAAFIDAVRLAGLPVEIAGQVDQPFFSVPAQILRVNGEDLQLFEYPEPATAASEAALIAPDGGFVDTSMMMWVGTPHFYVHDQFIVLYIGESDSLLKALNGILGEPIAEG